MASAIAASAAFLVNANNFAYSNLEVIELPFDVAFVQHHRGSRNDMNIHVYMNTCI